MAALPPEALAAVMREQIASTFTSARSTQEWLLSDRDLPLIDTLTFQTRGRFSEEETLALLESVSEVAHPYGRAGEAATAATFEDAGINYGWPSYRTALTAPTDGPVALAISWRFTVPYRETVISEIENLWVHNVGTPILVTDPRPEREPITIGDTALRVGPSTILWMRNGIFNPAVIEDALKPRVCTEGGIELLSQAERDLLQRVMRALVDSAQPVLDEIGAYEHGGDPYMWTHNYGHFGDVHFIMPPGDLADWNVDVMQVDDQPGASFLVVGMWTREEGSSDLSLEINFFNDPESGSVRGEFVNLHVM